MQLAALASLKAWQQLVCLFIFWKFLLLSIASLSPGPGYDTSTQLLFSSGLSEPADHGHSARFAFLQLVAEKLTRWDGIYLASLAHRGYVYEQEWAFSWGFTRLMSLLGKEFSSEPQSALVIHALSGILLANLSHLLAVLVLYRLATLLTSLDQDGHRMAFLTAALHILSPAGLFLSAPYGESFFALLNFAGMLSYAFAAFCTSDIRADLSLILAGVSFGAAAAVRSNGLLSGVIFAADCVPVLHLIWVDRWPQLTDLHRLAVLGIAGSLTAAGFALPQVMAYGEYCTGNAGDDRREWCKRTLPSIYSWVQDHYWNVGFLRYWTLSNVPLFILAVPGLYLMFSTALQALFNPPVYDSALSKRVSEESTAQAKDPAEVALPLRYPGYSMHCFRQLALPQAVLTVLAFTSFHVQIITRISSGYPIWYIMLAHAITKRQTLPGGIKPEWVVRWMVVYGFVQGGLFASFLPPA